MINRNLQLWSEQAKKNDEIAENKFADVDYYNGNSSYESGDYVKAAYYYESIASTTTDYLVFFRLGLMYGMPRGLEFNFIKAEKYYLRSIELGGGAINNLGCLYLKVNEIKKGISLIELDLKLSTHVLTQHTNLGCAYIALNGVENELKGKYYCQKGYSTDHAFVKEKLLKLNRYPLVVLENPLNDNDAKIYSDRLYERANNTMRLRYPGLHLALSLFEMSAYYKNPKAILALAEYYEFEESQKAKAENYYEYGFQYFTIHEIAQAAKFFQRRKNTDKAIEF